MILTNSNRKTFNVDRLNDDFIKTNQSEKVLIIVPTNRKARQLKKMFISQSPGQILSQLNIETLWTFADKIYRIENNFIKLESPAANVLLNQCYKTLKPKSLIRYNDSLPYGTQESIKNFFSKLKERGIYPEKFEQKLGFVKNSYREKAEDLLQIYKLYFEKTSRSNLLEIGDVFNNLKSFPTSKIIKDFQYYYPEVKTVILIGFDYLSEPEIYFLSELIRCGVFEIIIKFDFYKYNPKLFGYLIETFHVLKKSGLHEIDEFQPEISSYKKHLIENLFRKKKTNRKLLLNQIYKLQAYNRQQEVDFIAKEIKILLLEKNVKPNKICVVFNQIKNYSVIIRDVFNNYQIPLNMTDRFTLHQSAPIAAIINLLEILENNFSILSIQRALATKLFRHEVNINNLIKFSRHYKITSNYNRWINTINSAKKENNTDYFDLEKLEHDLVWIKKLLESLEKKLSAKNVLSELDNLLVSLNIIQNILKMDSSTAEKNIRAIEIFYKNTEKMFNLLEDEKPGSSYSINNILEILRSIAANTRFNIKETSTESILVTSVDEIRGLNFDYLFIGGLCYNDFPTRYTAELLSFEGDEVLKTKQMQKERFRFFQGITSWSKSLFLSFPQFESESELVKSNFLVELEEIFDISEVDYRKYEERIFINQDEQRILGAGNYELNSFSKKLNTKQYTTFLEKIEIDIKRRTDFESEYNGNLLPDNTDEKSTEFSRIKEALQKRKSYQYSASELETYSKCPFQYFMRRILNVNVEREPTEFLESIELGNYLHKIFFKFFLELRKRNIALKNCSDADFNEAKKIIFQVAEQVIPKELINSPYTFYDIEKIFGLNNNQEDSILFRLIYYERNQNDFSPKYFEVSFGDIKQENDELLSDKAAINANDVFLKGKIDRIDIDENKFRVVDYKLSGKKPTTKDLADGLGLQLPIYAFAAEVLLKESFKESFELDSMKIFSLKYVEDSFKLINYNNKDLNNKELIELVLGKIKANVEGIINGNFPLTVLENFSSRVCKVCDYSSVCRINEIK